MGGRGGQKWTKKKKKRMSEVGAQALLLIGPGAELDWAELSDTLPSVGEEAETLINTREQQQTQQQLRTVWCGLSLQPRIPCCATNHERQAMSAHAREEE